MRIALGILTAAFLLSFACGGGEDTTPSPTVGPPTEATPTRTAPIPTPTLRVAATPTPTRTVVTPATPTPAPTATPAAKAPALTKLRIAATSFGFDQVRPNLNGVAGGLLIGGPIFDWITWAAPDGAVAPGVLTAWETSPDGKQWTVTVRQGMRFHNGDSLSAEDVKFTLERLVYSVRNEAQPSTDSRPWEARLDSVDLLSPTRLRINLKVPWALMIIDSSVKNGPAGAVLPKAYFERVGAAGFDASPVGTGPWKLVRHNSGVSFTYEATGVGHPYRESPKFKEMEMLLVPEEATRVAMLKTGAAELAEIANFVTINDVRNRAGFQIFTTSPFMIPFATFYGTYDSRIQGKPLSSRQVREALDLAIDRDELIDTLLGGVATAAPRPIVAPGTLGYDPSWKPTEFNPTRAKELLAQAGYPSGFALTVRQPRAGGPPILGPLTEAVAGYWANIGIRPEIVPIDYAQLIAMHRAVERPGGRRDIHDDLVGTTTVGWSLITPTNLSILATFTTSRGTSKMILTPQSEALYDELVESLDETKQVQIIRQIVDLIYQERAAAPLALVPGTWAARPSIGSWKALPTPGVGVFLETVTQR